jgi:DNA-binding response OmpR family regulator
MRDRIAVRVLVIDDDEKVCRRLAGWLEAQAYEVAAFTDPREGLAHAAHTPCELALVDLRLPDADGAEVITRLRLARAQMRVIAMSAFPKVDEARQATDAGASQLIEKPIQRGALLAALEHQLAQIGIPVRAEAEFNRRLGARLRKLRRDAGRRQYEVAESAGITPAQLSQIELGKTATSTWTLARITGTLQIPLATLFDGL